MAIRNFLSKTAGWFNNRTKADGFSTALDKDGLIDAVAMEDLPTQNESKAVVVKKVPALRREQSMELVQKGLTDLVSQLNGINANLSKQVGQHEELMSRIQDLPDMIQSLPDAVKNQSDTVGTLLEQLKADSIRNMQFIEAIEKIPVETGKQTDAMENISHQLAAGAEADVHFAESFNKFKHSLEGLDRTTGTQTDSIVRMNKTFAASDRYMKYLVSKQNKRFLWIFIASITISSLSIIALLTALALVLNR